MTAARAHCAPMNRTNTSHVHIVAFASGTVRPMCATAWDRSWIHYRVTEEKATCPACLRAWKESGR